MVFLSLLEGKSQCEIQRIFKAEDKAVSRYYIQSCLADYDAYGNPDHRNEVGAFRIESLGPAQSAWLKELLLKTPDLFFFEIESQFVRQCVRTTPFAAYATCGLWLARIVTVGRGQLEAPDIPLFNLEGTACRRALAQGLGAACQAAQRGLARALQGGVACDGGGGGLLGTVATAVLGAVSDWALQGRD